jgi:hypothetical protein
LHYGYTALLAQVNNVKTLSEELSAELALGAVGDKNIQDLDKSLEASYKALKQRWQTETKSTVVGNIINLRFDDFEQSTQIQYVKNLQGDHFDDYANYIMGLVSI